MVRYTGKLSVGKEGLSIHTYVSQSNPEKYDIPLKELFAESIGKEVSITINRVKPFKYDKIDYSSVKSSELAKVKGSEKEGEHDKEGEEY